jgi:metal-responsive CopG/Arc/MetJ family transcriptional regulator
MARKRITISLNLDITGDKAIFDFLSGLRRRTRSEIIKEILFDALEERNENAKPDPPTITVISEPGGIDPDEIMEKLF